MLEWSVPFLRFDFDDCDEGCRPLAFADPVDLIVVNELPDVRSALRLIQDAVEQGLWAAGYVSYEAAPALDRAMRVSAVHRAPLVWFGLFDQPLEPIPNPEPGRFRLSVWKPTIEGDRYGC